jgi:crotonobetainyl-CoA:carnitine CoA-transferase CaiB-like acyl-CoA transferase
LELARVVPCGTAEASAEAHQERDPTVRTEVFAGLRVVEFADSLAAGHAGQLLADFGAEVAQVERPGGSDLRQSAAYPFLARGKKSIELDLGTVSGRARAARLVAAADVCIQAWRPGVAEKLGLDYRTLAAGNPGLVHAWISGFGGVGPYADVKGYEALVMARIGGSHMLGPLLSRSGPAFSAMPFCSFSAGQTALHGILAALLERSRTGLGQQTETSLVQGIAGHDPWNWFLHFLTLTYPDAFDPAPHIEDGVPNSALIFRLLVALSGDGEWLQFSQTSRHLFEALLRALDLGDVVDAGDWDAAPLYEDKAKRVELWNRMVRMVKAKSLDQWREVFDLDPNVWAETFRKGSEALQHPQLVHDGGVVSIEDPVYGAVRQPGPLVRLSATPARLGRPAPRVNEGAEEVAAWTPRARSSSPASAGVASLPLAGVTVLELGMYYAAPYGTALLSDLGARVIKFEPLEGDPMRTLASFPEVGGIKVLQGKECVAIDIGTAEGRKVVYELVARCDVVLQSFRAGVAERLRLDAETLTGINPDLIYVHSPGYGVDGPCGHRPAYGSTIAAATGIVWRIAAATMPAATGGLDLEGTKDASLRLTTAANTSFAQCDGLSALVVATAVLLGLVARANGVGGQRLYTSMVNSGVHANCEDVLDYAGHERTPQPDAQLLGFGACYRLYPAARGWICLAAPYEREWSALAGALAGYAPLAQDPRFATAEARRVNDGQLQQVLAGIFRTRTAAEWERDLCAADVGCVEVAEASVSSVLMSDEFGRASRLVADVEHPMLGPHPRLAPLARFSRSSVQARPAHLLGQDTETLLAELGYHQHAIDELVKLGVAKR